MNKAIILKDILQIIQEEWKWKDSLASTCAVLLFVGMVCAALYGFRQGIASKNWPNVKGKIIESRIEKEVWETREGTKVVEVARIKYEYEIKGKLLINDKVSLGKNTFADATVKQFPKGKDVTVYYNPKNPQEAVLVQGATWGAFKIVFFIGGILLALLLIPIVISIQEILLAISVKRKVPSP